jgi:hypothetical protein
MSWLVTRTCAGIPSRVATRAGPCDSPAVNHRSTKRVCHAMAGHPCHTRRCREALGERAFTSGQLPHGTLHVRARPANAARPAAYSTSGATVRPVISWI